MDHEALFGRTRVILLRGDITTQEADAIVNAANARLAGGGGVDGAIHRAGGPEILEACRGIGGCPTGEAVATTAGRLPARVVIHAVGPIWTGGGGGEGRLLASAYRRSLEVAEAEGCRSVVFPSISTGAHGYPVEEATRIALGEVRAAIERRPEAFEEVRFALFDEPTLRRYAEALSALEG